MPLRKLVLCVSMALALVACASTGSSNSSGEPRSKRVGTSDKEQGAALHVKLGREYLDKGHYEVAHEKLEKALELDEKSADAHTLMAILYERIDRAKFAEKHYRRAAEIDPEDGSTNNNLGAFLCGVGKYDEADRYFLRALDDPFYKTPAAAYSNAGVCAARAGNSEKSEGYFRKALETNPKDAGALYEMALISFKKSDFLRARAFIQRFEAASAPAASALDLAAQIEERLGDKRAAAKYRERLKSEFPDYEPGNATRGSNSP